jgi:hypothetical protein
VHAHQAQQAELELKVWVGIVTGGLGSRQQNAGRNHHHEADSLPVAQLCDHIGSELAPHGESEQAQVRDQNGAAEQRNGG